MKPEGFELFPLKGRELVGEGGSGMVYSVSDSLVVKVLRSWYYHVSEICHEYRICSLLHDEGISVPKPEGVFRVDVNGGEAVGFVMEWVRGLSGSGVHWRYANRVMDLKYAELEKAKGKGFYPSLDYAIWNSIYVPEKDRLYLIDFEGWNLKDSSRLGSVPLIKSAPLVAKKL